jgi:hypothetical protein
MTTLEHRISAQRERVQRAAGRVGRPASEVTIVAISKTKPASAIRDAQGVGIVDFGESYVPEWQSKSSEIDGVRWHFVGHLQSNKARALAGRVHCIHSVGSVSVIRELERAGVPQNVMIQVNVAADPAKSGFRPAELGGVLGRIESGKQLKAVGLMTIGPLVSEPELARPHFSSLRELRDAHRRQHPELQFLSMGMSRDLEVAVEEGATHVRIGTAIFGPRVTQ